MYNLLEQNVTIRDLEACFFPSCQHDHWITWSPKAFQVCNDDGVVFTHTFDIERARFEALWHPSLNVFVVITTFNYINLCMLDVFDYGLKPFKCRQTDKRHFSYCDDHKLKRAQWVNHGASVMIDFSADTMETVYTVNIRGATPRQRDAAVHAVGTQLTPDIVRHVLKPML